MSETLGGRLRKQREERNVSLSAIADETKIAVALLDGLERDDVSRWPTGIFRRAFVRAYARAIGLDADAVLQEFACAHPEPVDPAVIAAEAAAAAGGADDTRGFRRRFSSTLRALAADRSEATAVELGRLALAARGRTGDGPGTDRGRIGDGSGTDSGRSGDGVGTERGRIGDGAGTDPGRILAEQPVVVDPPPVTVEPRFELDLRETAVICTQVAQARDLGSIDPLLDAMRRVLDARGLILWQARTDTSRLAAIGGAGYSPELIAQLPAVGRDADNATAAAYRSGDVSIVASSGSSSGAIVAPSIAADGVVGVLAIEVPSGRERDASVQSAAAIWAAQLAALLANAVAENFAERKRAV